MHTYHMYMYMPGGLAPVACLLCHASPPTLPLPSPDVTLLTFTLFILPSFAFGCCLVAYHTHTHTSADSIATPCLPCTHPAHRVPHHPAHTSIYLLLLSAHCISLPTLPALPSFAPFAFTGDGADPSLLLLPYSSLSVSLDFPMQVLLLYFVGGVFMETWHDMVDRHGMGDKIAWHGVNNLLPI